MTQSALVLKPRPGTIGFLGSHDTLSAEDLPDAMRADSTMFPTSYYQITEIATPMTPAAFEAQFVPQIQLIGTNQMLGTLGRTATNFVQTSSINCNFFLKAIRIVLIAEPEQWAMAGARSLFAAGPQPAFDGTFPPLSLLSPATFEYGKNTLIAVRKMLEWADFEFTVGCDYPLVQTNLARVGCVQMDAAVKGAGSPLTAAARKIRAGNIQAAINGRVDYFQWQNSDGALGLAGAPATPGGVGGSTDNDGETTDGWYDIRNGQGLVLPANQSFQATITQSVGSQVAFSQFREEMTEDTTGVTPAPGLTSVVTGSPGLDGGIYEFKFGLFKFGLELRGAKIKNKACFDWAVNHGGGLGKAFFDTNESWNKIAENASFAKEYETSSNKKYRSLGEAVESADRELAEVRVPPHQKRDGRS